MADSSFVESAIRRKRLFAALSALGVAVGVSLGVYYTVQRVLNPDYPIGIRIVVVILILLNARQNLRQFRYAHELERLTRR